MTIKTEIVDDYERTVTSIEKTKTERGFGLIKFTDRYHQECSLQDSSLATEAAIWFGVDDSGPHLRKTPGAPYRMHLTQTMVKQLLPYLKEFAETGSYIGDMSELQNTPCVSRSTRLQWLHWFFWRNKWHGNSK